MKHTPGEFAGFMRADGRPLEISEYHLLLQFVDWLQDTRPEYAAAPELLEACRKSLEVMPERWELHNILTAVIAKAAGE